MKSVIICFSQTGNTRTIADKIQEGIRTGGHECDIISMKHAKDADLSIYDLTGIGAPTFFYREPLNVNHYIKGMEPGDSRHCFMFCTHGSIIGNTFHYMHKGLSNRGYQVIDAFDTYADSSLQFYPDVMHTTGHPDAAELSEAVEFGKNIFSKSLAVRSGELKTLPEFPLVEDTWWAAAAKVLTLENLKRSFPVFTIDTEKCTQCLECEENCPVDAITIDADPPEIQKDGCIYCLYCEKQCPEGAIIADWTQTTRMIRPNLIKYVQVLKEAQHRGEFRPYVDYEKII
jgi:flavodoxin/ferredoxin